MCVESAGSLSCRSLNGWVALPVWQGIERAPKRMTKATVTSSYIKLHHCNSLAAPREAVEDLCCLKRPITLKCKSFLQGQPEARVASSGGEPPKQCKIKRHLRSMFRGSNTIKTKIIKMFSIHAAQNPPVLSRSARFLHRTPLSPCL